MATIGDELAALRDELAGLDTCSLAELREQARRADATLHAVRTASALKFMVDTGLQVLLVTPPDKAGGLLPHVNCVRTVVRQDNHSFVLEIDKRQVEA